MSFLTPLNCDPCQQFHQLRTGVRAAQHTQARPNEVRGGIAEQSLEGPVHVQDGLCRRPSVDDRDSTGGSRERPVAQKQLLLRLLTLDDLLFETCNQQHAFE